MTVKYDFSGKTVLITGAASGFGKAAAQAFANSGARLALLDINMQQLKDSSLVLDETGAEYLLLRCDISNPAEVNSAFNRLKEHYGSLDIAINNAGVVHPLNRIADLTEDEFDKTINVNLKGTFLCMQQELSIMLETSTGTILNTASVSGLIGSPFLGLYAAAKHGVLGLTRSAALEYGRKGIRVNALCPTFATTPMLDEIAGEKGQKFQQHLASQVPMLRLATTQEVVEAMQWLCSDNNSYMNGAAVTIDGGLTAA
ncbi:SDR family oxidoreductase [Shewanella corallii]|uniref:SDR family oxidoreductase n=1 Tax=Shewanella corallii TaxID=560080 RepID=A0ABT0NAP5_9GAMM|nr:SDR family oxidoreductase [Shewanella corallii]MCL2915516.1 SDR family oxidoreductase [Shewanella corallii]